MERDDSPFVDAFVLANHREGRTRHPIAHPQAPRHALGEGRLTRPQNSAQEDDVTGPQQRGELLTRPLRVVRARRVSTPTHDASRSRRTTRRSLPNPSTTFGPPRSAAAG